jgi:cyanophycin synthetase
MLRAVGVPVPAGRTVKSGDDAWEAAQDIGMPAVIKPEDGNQEKGVTVILREGLAFDAASVGVVTISPRPPGHRRREHP